jgi:hypothetical protein
MFLLGFPTAFTDYIRFTSSVLLRELDGFLTISAISIADAAGLGTGYRSGSAETDSPESVLNLGVYTRAR